MFNKFLKLSIKAPPNRYCVSIFVVLLTKASLPPVWDHGCQLEGLTGFLYPTPPWTWSWVTGSGSCCHLDGSAQELFVSWATCRGRQSSTLEWSCRHLIRDCRMVATGDRATLNGNWSNFLWKQATCSFLMCLRVCNLNISAALWFILSATVSLSGALLG